MRFGAEKAQLLSTPVPSNLRESFGCLLDSFITLPGKGNTAPGLRNYVSYPGGVDEEFYNSSAQGWGCDKLRLCAGLRWLGLLIPDEFLKSSGGFLAAPPS